MVELRIVDVRIADVRIVGENRGLGIVGEGRRCENRRVTIVDADHGSTVLH